MGQVKLIKHSSQNYPHPYPQGVDFFVDKMCGHGAKFFYYDNIIKIPENYIEMSTNLFKYIQNCRQIAINCPEYNRINIHKYWTKRAKLSIYDS